MAPFGISEVAGWSMPLLISAWVDSMRGSLSGGKPDVLLPTQFRDP
jgi:hypothetical protein